MALQWMDFAHGAHLIVWHAGFHLRGLDRAQTQAGPPGILEVARHVTDLRNAWPRSSHGQPPFLKDLPALHSIPSSPDQDGPMEQARQLGQLSLVSTTGSVP